MGIPIDHAITVAVHDGAALAEQLRAHAADLDTGREYQTADDLEVIADIRALADAVEGLT